MFAFARAVAAPTTPHRRDRLLPVKWAGGLYAAGVLAHFSDHMAYQLAAGLPLDQVLTSAPLCLVWPADLIGALLALT